MAIHFSDGAFTEIRISQAVQSRHKVLMGSNSFRADTYELATSARAHERSPAARCSGAARVSVEPAHISRGGRNHRRIKCWLGLGRHPGERYLEQQRSAGGRRNGAAAL